MFTSLLLSLLLVQELDMGGKLSANQVAIDSKELRLVLTVDPGNETISGFAETRFAIVAPVEILELELVDTFTVTKVLIDGKPRPFKHAGHRLTAPIPEDVKGTMMVRVEYHGKPWRAKRPPWSGGVNWSKTDSGQPWIGVSCQGEGGQVWFPCKGHQVDKFEGLTLEITVPEPLYCAANGLLKEIKPAAREGWRTFHWYSKYPIASYNVNINIADYQILEGTHRGSKEMPVILYFLKEYQKADRASGAESYAAKLENLKNLAVEYLDVLSQYYGEYPFIDEKFGLAHTDYYGMEHQTINAYGAHFMQRDGLDTLMIHEMGHEWWGNKLTVADLADFWIQEGICTYTTGVYLEHSKGLEAALRYYRSQWFRVSNSRPLVQGKDITQGQAYFPDIYNKGALVIHALRWLIGRDELNKTLKTFMNREENTYVNSASTAQLIEIAEKTSGRDLKWFFDRYVYKAEAPRLSWNKQGDTLHMEWQEASFNMPIEIALTNGDQTRFERVPFEDGQATFVIPAGYTHEIDPRQWVYKKIEPSKN